MNAACKPAYKESAIGWIPEGWQFSYLSDIADINPSRTRPESENSEVSFLAMGDVSEDGRVLNRQIRSYQDVAKGFTSFTDHDVLVAKITPCFENGKGALVTQLLGGVGFGSTEFHVIRAKTSLSLPSFLHMHTRSDAFRRLGEKNMVGSAGQKRVPTEFLRQYPIPLPPLHEQQKITAVLTSVDDKLDVISRQIAATKTLRQGLLQTLLSRGVGTQVTAGFWRPHTSFKTGAHGVFPACWDEVSLGTIAPIVRRPVEISPDAIYPELGLRSYGKGTFHKRGLLGSEVGNKRLFEIKTGDLLFSNVFAWEGAVAIAKPQDDGRFGSHRYIACVVDDSRADTSFVFRFLTTPVGINLLTLASPGGAGRNKTLGLSALAKIVIPLPPLEEQQKITQNLDGVDAKLNALERKLANYQALKRGLMQKLLTGEWRVKLDSTIANA
jgi:type I restriction enzyme S subunit